MSFKTIKSLLIGILVLLLLAGGYAFYAVIRSKSPAQSADEMTGNLNPLEINKAIPDVQTVVVQPVFPYAEGGSEISTITPLTLDTKEMTPEGVINLRVFANKDLSPQPILFKIYPTRIMLLEKSADDFYNSLVTGGSVKYTFYVTHPKKQDLNEYISGICRSEECKTHVNAMADSNQVNNYKLESILQGEANVEVDLTNRVFVTRIVQLP